MPMFFENKNSRYNTEVTVGNLRMLIYDARYLTDLNAVSAAHNAAFDAHAKIGQMQKSAVVFRVSDKSDKSDKSDRIAAGALP